GELLEDAGLRSVRETTFTASVQFASFREWWEPFTLGVGPAGAYVSGLTAEGRAGLREHCRRVLPDAPFVLTARAWAARGLA
ncbi:MAG: SAM-dependent methyltransferase, partial [Actinomycetota bacterium]